MTNRRTFFALLGAVSTGLATQVLAGGHHHCHVCCPDCGNKVCVATPTPIKEKKTAYRCECKDVCIPAVKGPFVPCCEPPSCGRVRTVKVLKKTEYECERCGYKWHVMQQQCGCGK